jgi:hypothetical protein
MPRLKIHQHKISDDHLLPLWYEKGLVAEYGSYTLKCKGSKEVLKHQYADDNDFYKTVKAKEFQITLDKKFVLCRKNNCSMEFDSWDEGMDALRQLGKEENKKIQEKKNNNSSQVKKCKHKAVITVNQLNYYKRWAEACKRAKLFTWTKTDEDYLQNIDLIISNIRHNEYICKRREQNSK